MRLLSPDQARAMIAFANLGHVRSSHTQRAAIKAFNTIKDILTPEEYTAVNSAWATAAKSDEGAPNFKLVMSTLLNTMWT